MSTQFSQSKARRIAREQGGIATQLSRFHGHWGNPNEPWVVVLPSGDLFDDTPPPPKPTRQVSVSLMRFVSQDTVPLVEGLSYQEQIEAFYGSNYDPDADRLEWSEEDVEDYDGEDGA